MFIASHIPERIGRNLFNVSGHHLNHIKNMIKDFLQNFTYFDNFEPRVTKHKNFSKFNIDINSDNFFQEELGAETILRTHLGSHFAELDLTDKSRILILGEVFRPIKLKNYHTYEIMHNCDLLQFNESFSVWEKIIDDLFKRLLPDCKINIKKVKVPFAEFAKSIYVSTGGNLVVGGYGVVKKSVFNSLDCTAPAFYISLQLDRIAIVKYKINHISNFWEEVFKDKLIYIDYEEEISHDIIINVARECCRTMLYSLEFLTKLNFGNEIRTRVKICYPGIASNDFLNEIILKLNRLYTNAKISVC